MPARWIASLILMGTTLSTYGLQADQYCLDNQLSSAYSAVASNVGIGITIERNEKTVFPVNGKPMNLKRGQKWCRNIKPEEQLIIHESRFFKKWSFRKAFPASLLKGIRVEFGKSGRISELYGINLVQDFDANDQFPQPNQWMTELYKNSDTPLNQICIPGTHDSGSYDITTFSEEDPYMWESLKKLFDYYAESYLFTPFKELVRWWAVTQGLNTYQQLSAGIRYLDIRPRKINGQLVTVHGLAGASIADIVIDIRRFLNENPREIIMFHIHQPFGMTQDDIDELFQVLFENFGSSIAPASILPSTSIQQFQNSGYQVIVVSTLHSPVFSGWSTTETLTSLWHNKNRPYPLLESIVSNLEHRNNNQLHITQMTMTESPSDLKQGAIPGQPSSLRAFARTLRYPSGFLRYAANAARTNSNRVNIVTVDFPEDDYIYSACMRENIMNISHQSF
ncbi:phosphatidylinositol-specific phospholipase C domain-containing protein [Endozoicomonas elysicola]|nr:phosphatidylinositol-specific phospholipase C domain-containing protein [Endozoicomonas elysicola]